MQQEWRGREDSLREQLRNSTENTAAQIKDLQHRAQQAEERLKGHIFEFIRLFLLEILNDNLGTQLRTARIMVVGFTFT